MGAEIHKLETQSGFSLPELLISVTILLIISATVTSGILQITSSQKTIWNRTQLHAGVRSATELLQQEVGQAGRIAMPGPASLASAVGTGVQTVGINQVINGATVASVAGIFANERLTIDAGTVADGTSHYETVQVTAVDTVGKTITAVFDYSHEAGVPVSALGGFATGIVPDQKWTGAAWAAYPNGSDGTHLKLYGDINGDGKMVFVEYFCDTAGGNLYRNIVAFDAAPPKPPLTSSLVLLGNILPNPGGTPCFTYMPSPLPFLTAVTDANCACAQVFVLDVAITLTVQTQLKDPITNQFQTETKALLNVSPRNVFNVWQLASAGSVYGNRLQPMPATVAALLP
jgi:prepilin-type N-terminal cleavage/methylation domain-containing protein